jgi:ADP-ribose pyrophosphatase
LTIRKDTPSRVVQESAERVVEGHISLDRFSVSIEGFSGEMSKPMTRDLARVGRSTAVLLYDPREHRFVLNEQFRLGAYVNGVERPWLLETVAGMVDEGETLEAAARREVEEETGCKAGQMELIGRYLTTPGLFDEFITIFVAEVDATKAGGVHGQDAEGEEIRTEVVPVEEALAAADRGEMLNIVTQVTMLWFARHGEALRGRWLSEPAAGSEVGPNARIGGNGRA